MRNNLGGVIFYSLTPHLKSTKHHIRSLLDKEHIFSVNRFDFF